MAAVGCANGEAPHAAHDDRPEDAMAAAVEDSSGTEAVVDDSGASDGVAPAAVVKDAANPADAQAGEPLVAIDAGLALADGFESAAVGGPPDPALWSIAQPDCTGSGTLAVDDSQAHTGKHSVRVDGGGGYCDHIFIDNASVISTLGGQVYARFFIRLSAPLGAGHVTFLAMKDDADQGDDVRMGGQDMVLMYNRQSDDATLPTLSPTGAGDSVMLAAETWDCIEFHFDEHAGTIDTWVDGREIAGLVENGTSTPDISTQWLSRANWRPSLSDFRLGWESYSGQAMTLWFDDVALSSARIGCGS
jgi:hypothetical protein